MMPGLDGAADGGLLRLLQSFASTSRGGPGEDLLRTREDAAAWLHAAELLAPDAGLTNSEHAALVRLRDAIRDVLAAHSYGRDDAGAAARLTKALADGRLVLTVDSSSAPRLVSAARSSYPSVVAAFAIAIAGSAEDWLRLKLGTPPAP
jgi:Putative stress-induced transcription regulator